MQFDHSCPTRTGVLRQGYVSVNNFFRSVRQQRVYQRWVGMVFLALGCNTVPQELYEMPGLSDVHPEEPIDVATWRAVPLRRYGSLSGEDGQLVLEAPIDDATVSQR